METTINHLLTILTKYNKKTLDNIKNYNDKISYLCKCIVIQEKKKNKDEKNKQILKKQSESVMNIEKMKEINHNKQFLNNPQITYISNIRNYKKPIFIKCYTCGKSYDIINNCDAFYDKLCPSCAILNKSKRILYKNDIYKNRTVLITGGRTKTGFETLLRLIKLGYKNIIITTRFPRNCAKKIIEYIMPTETNIDIYGLDFRHIPSVTKFAEYIEKKYPVINDFIDYAYQTVRRPAGYYTHLISYENEDKEKWNKYELLWVNTDCIMKDYGKPNFEYINNLSLIPEQKNELIEFYKSIKTIGSANFTQVCVTQNDDFESITKNSIICPKGKYDLYNEQIDLREENSWTMKPNEIPIQELIEIQIVNITSPYIILKMLINGPMKQLNNFESPNCIVYVSAIEGLFTTYNKPNRHIHANMCKSAMHQFIYTSYKYLHIHGININAVDIGWISKEFPLNKYSNITPPLDEIDGASRIIDNINENVINKKNITGHYIKNYKIHSW